jgi:hypothetical protein
MTRGIKAKTDRKSVQSIVVAIRLNEYELEAIMIHLDIERSKKSIGNYVSDIVKEHIKKELAP